MTILVVLLVMMYFRKELSEVFSGCKNLVGVANNMVTGLSIDVAKDNKDSWEKMFADEGITSGTFAEKMAELKKRYGLH